MFPVSTYQVMLQGPKPLLASQLINLTSRKRKANGTSKMGHCIVLSTPGPVNSVSFSILVRCGDRNLECQMSLITTYVIFRERSCKKLSLSDIFVKSAGLAFFYGEQFNLSTLLMDDLCYRLSFTCCYCFCNLGSSLVFVDTEASASCA